MENKTNTQAVVELPREKRNIVLIGCFFLLLSIGMLGLSLNIALGPLLTATGNMGSFAIISVVGSLGMVVMTPIGGKLGDLYGRRNVVLVFGIVAVLSTVGLGVVKQIGVFILLRFIVSAAQGAFLSIPFACTMEICDSKLLPKMTGLLSTASALGTFLGSYIAGLLIDANRIRFALIFPVIPLLVGIVLFCTSMPNRRGSGKVVFDTAGMIVLIILLTTLFVPVTMGSAIGWTSPVILGSFVIAIVSFFGFIKLEKRAANPIVPLHLFKSKAYVCILVVGFTSFFLTVPMNTYLPLAVQQVIDGGTATQSGILQLPRSILMIIAPVFAGAWVSRKKQNCWIALLLAPIFSLISFLPLWKITSGTSLGLMIGCVALTAFVNCFRTVATSPLLRMHLDIRDIGIGMAMTNFFNTMSSLVSSSVSGAVFNMHSENLALGISNVNRIVVFVSMVGIVAAIIGIVSDKKVSETEAS